MPSTRNGIVLAIRCPKPACRNGEAAMPASPSASRGWMPALSRFPAATSIASTSHIRSTIAAITTKPPVRSRSDGCGLAGCAVMACESLGALGQAPLKPARDRRAQAGAVGLQAVVPAQAHHLAAGRLGRHPERVGLALDDQHGHLDGLEL